MINGLLKIVFGLLLVIGAIFIAISYPGWMQAVKDVIQGTVVIGLALFGLLFVLLGFTDMK